MAQIPPAEESPEDHGIHIAIVGRPNVGKSSLLNALLQQDRAIVSPIPGTTRDALDTPLKWEGQDVTLIDTAGIRRRGHVESGVEKYSVLRAVSAIDRADVALLVIDATMGVRAQDAHVAEFILDAYKSVVLIVNKWDAVEEKETDTAAIFAQQLRQNLKFLDYVPVLFVSALTRLRVSKILPLALTVAAQRKVRIPTGELNRLIRDAVTAHPAPNRTGQAAQVPVCDASRNRTANLRHLRERSRARAFLLCQIPGKPDSRRLSVFGHAAASGAPQSARRARLIHEATSLRIGRLVA